MPERTDQSTPTCSRRTPRRLDYRLPLLLRGDLPWGMDCERSIAAWRVGEWSAAAALNASPLANSRLPESVREAVERNASLIAA